MIYVVNHNHHFPCNKGGMQHCDAIHGIGLDWISPCEVKSTLRCLTKVSVSLHVCDHRETTCEVQSTFITVLLSPCYQLISHRETRSEGFPRRREALSKATTSRWASSRLASDILTAFWCNFQVSFSHFTNKDSIGSNMATAPRGCSLTLRNRNHSKLIQNALPRELWCQHRE